VDPASRVRGAATVSRAHDALWRAGDFGVIVLAADADEPVILEGTGAVLWNALESSCTADALVGELARSFGVGDRARVEDDVLPYLAELAHLGVVEVA
jgi:hypothetical protein